MKNFLLIPILMVCMSGFAQPTISSFSPTSAAVGATITITGTNFSSVATDNIVFFGGVKAVVNAATASTLTVNVPVGAGYQSISVTTNRLTAYSKAPFTVTFPGVGTPVTTASFTATDVQLTKPSAVVFADIDGDGKPDMIITNKLDSTVAVYRNKSTGGGVSFETKADFKLGVIPRFIIAGDVNGDGKQDIISMNINNALTEDASFTVLINKSVPGQVLMDLQKKNISRGTFPGLSFGDFDLDGKPDIAVASMDSSQLVIYGNSSIADTVRFNTEKKIALPFPPEYMINADLDGDGKTDLLFSRSGDSSLYVSKNISTPGNFSFEYPNPVGAASLSQSYNPFVIADFNGDAKPDVAVVHNLSGKVSIFKNTSTGTTISFTGKVDIAVGSKPLMLAAADLNGDGLIDLIVNNAASATMSVLRNTSSGGFTTFDTKVDFPVSTSGNTTDAIAAIADLDMNGAYDFVGYNASLNGFLVYQNRMLTSAQSPHIYSFTPAQGKQGDTITINGHTLTAVNAVRFGGVAAASFKVVSDSIVSAVIGNGKSGAVSVTATTGTDSLAGFIFTSSVSPKINSFTPSSGTNGDTISIKGLRFTGTTQVRFGNFAPPFTVISDSLVKVVLGGGGSGSVKLTTPAGTDSLAGFVFISSVPKINSFTPTSGTNGDTISIKGVKFTGTTSVYFGGVTAKTFTVISDSLVKAVVGTGGSGNVYLQNNAGTDSASGFVYTQPTGIPKITSYSPLTGTSGTKITIIGKNLYSVASISFGNTPAASFTVNNDTSISATVGGGASGFVKISGSTGKDSLNGFVYTAPIQPVKVNSFTPSSGGTGTVISIRGLKFTGTTSVSFGGTAAASFTVVSDSTINATVGSGASGFVIVRTPNGSDSLNGFVYTTTPTQPVKVNSFTPSNGGTGTVVSIKGLKFTGATSVSFGGTAAASFTVVSDSTINATVGSGASGFVIVRTPNGSDSLNGFVYTAPTQPVKVNSFTPSNGGTGTVISIRGLKFTGATSVSFGGTAAASFTVVSDSAINATVGSGASGFVVVRTPNGSDSLNGFVYTAPTQPVKVNSFTPSNGGTGTVISIRGLKFTGATSVSFGGTAAASFTVVSDSAINATVGSGASGFVVVRTPNGSDSLSGFSYSVPAVPEINLLDSTRNNLSFNTIKGSYSASQYFLIGGKRLQSNITIASPAYFQVSKNADTGFVSVLSVAPVNNTVDSTKIYVRFKADSAISITGNISLTATNAVTKMISVTGSSTCDSVTLVTPSINSITKDSTVCIRDSITLTADGTYSIYKWSTGESVKTITIKKSANVSLQVGSIPGCLSNLSPVLKVIKDSNAIPVLALTGDTTLISSNAPNYRWYFNNNLVAGNSSNKLIVKKIGFYGVETSNDKICWDRSNDYPIVMISSPLVNDTAAIKTYPNPSTGGVFTVVITLQRATNVATRVTVTDATGIVLLQTNKFIFFGKEIKIPITLNTSFKGTAFVKIDINGDIKTQTIILQ